MTLTEWWEQVEAYGLGLPEDYVLVPVEPTEKMFWAGDIALNHNEWGNMTSAYKAMIKAAQESD